MMKAHDNIIKNIERVFLRVSVICFFILVIFQSLHFINKDRTFLNNGTMLLNKEMVGTQTILPSGSLTLKTADKGDFRGLMVFINGEMYGSLKDGKIHLYVRDGDIVEIDGSKLSKPVEIKTVGVSENLKKSNLKNSYIIYHSRTILFTVKI